MFTTITISKYDLELIAGRRESKGDGFDGRVYARLRENAIDTLEHLDYLGDDVEVNAVKRTSGIADALAELVKCERALVDVRRTLGF
jgi:hypothetical protein